MQRRVLDAARQISEECICIGSRQLSRALTRLYDEDLRAGGLRTSQLAVLVAVARFGERGASMGGLAKVLVMERTTLSRNVRPLESAGLLRVARDPADARGRIVLLTSAGERAIEAAHPLWERSQKRLRALLGGKKSGDLRATLSRALERLDR
jgi:DNA-binding MarR family transcriptional regulator